MSRRYKFIEDRIFMNIEISDFDCWEWQGGKLRGGYGNLRINGKSYQAHRFSYELFVGKIPEGMLVCHKCDNPSCVNPEHLFLGTHKTNAEDKMHKSRHPLGEKASNSKLKEKEIYEIRRYASLGISRRVIAKMFCVGATCITYAINRKTWGWLK